MTFRNFRETAHRRLEDWRRDTRGASAVVFAAALPVLLVAAGVTVESIRLGNAKNNLQEIADSAALAGTATLGDNYSKKDRESRALDAAMRFFKAEAPPEAVATIAMRPNGKGVAVKATEDVTLTFGGILNRDKATVGVAGEAVLRPGFPICMLALDPNAPIGIEIGGSGDVDAPDCIFWSNSTKSGSFTGNGSADLVNKFTCAVGGYSRGGSFKATPTPEANCIELENPFAATTFPSTAGCTYNLFTKLAGKDEIIQLSPGTYCGGMTVNGGKVIFTPGLYVIKDGPMIVTANSDITGTNVGIYLTGISSFATFTGNGTVSLTARSIEPMAGVVMARDAKAPVSDLTKLTGASKLLVDGALYFPTQPIEMTGNTFVEFSPRPSIVAKSIKIWGSGGVHFRRDPKLAGKSFIFYEGVRLVR